MRIDTEAGWSVVVVPPRPHRSGNSSLFSGIVRATGGEQRWVGKPYFRANPMSSVLYEAWRSTCEQGFALYGRGVLYRSVAVGLGESAFGHNSLLKSTS